MGVKGVSLCGKRRPKGGLVENSWKSSFHGRDEVVDVQLPKLKNKTKPERTMTLAHGRLQDLHISLQARTQA